MKTQKKIFWVTATISIISLFLFIAFSTFLNDKDYHSIFSSISISVFGSSLLVLIPSMISFKKNQSDAKQYIIIHLSEIENTINDIHFQSTFIRSADGSYNLDFSFEKTKYDLLDDMNNYIVEKDIYDMSVKKFNQLYECFRKLQYSDFSVFDVCLNEYINLVRSCKIVHNLSKKYKEIVDKFLLEKDKMFYSHAVRLYDSGNATTGQFFDIWFKKFFEQIDPMLLQLEYLRTIFNIYRLYFYKQSYKQTILSNELDKKHELKKYIEKFYQENHLEQERFIKKLLKDLSKNAKIKP